MTVKASWDVVSELMSEAPPLPDYDFTAIHMDGDTDPFEEE